MFLIFPLLILCFLIFLSPNLLFVNSLVSYNYVNSNIKFICNAFLVTHSNQHIVYSVYYGFIFVKSLCNTSITLHCIFIYFCLFLILIVNTWLNIYMNTLQCCSAYPYPMSAQLWFSKQCDHFALI